MTADFAQPLAIDGGPPVRATPWPVDPPAAPASDPDPRGVIAREVAAHLHVDAGRVVLFPDRASVLAAALAVAVRGGDELVLPAIGAHAWAAAAIAAGLRPVPAEVDGETGTLSPNALSRSLSPATGGIVAAAVFGHPAALTELARVSEPPDIPLIEDASVALGASEHGHAAGTAGAVGVMRLGPRGAGDTPFALVAPDSSELLGRGGDAVVSEEAARHGLGWLRAEPAALAVRRQLAWELTFGVRGIRGIARMHHGRYVRHAYGAYVVRLRRLVWKRSLDDTLAALAAEGIPCTAAFAHHSLHADDAVRAALGDGDARLAVDHFPAAERLPDEWFAISLPSAGRQREVDDIVTALRKLEAANG